jgi:hypothetical protein
MTDKYRISKIWRILSGLLGVASFLLIIAHSVTEGLFNWFEIGVIIGIGSLFLWVALHGKSPKWLEEETKLFPEK